MRPAPQTLSLVRARVQPAAATIGRLTATAVLAYVAALPLPGSDRPVLAPLTALLVVQVSLYQTLRNAVQRVASVIAGVLVALALSIVIGFTWWSLGITIAASLAIGFALRLRESLLEVPISAMLILSLATSSAGTDRILETLVGAAAGLVAGLVFAPVRVELAEEAIDELSRRIADLMDQMASGLAEGSGPDRFAQWLEQARALRPEIEPVERALDQAEDSLRLNPRGLLVAHPSIALRQRLEILEHVAITVRGIARALADLSSVTDESSPVRQPDAAGRLGAVLHDLAAAVRDYGWLTRSYPVERDVRRSDLERHLSAAKEHQARAAEALAAEPAVRPDWALRGELLVHLDRFGKELSRDPDLQRRAPIARRLLRRPARNVRTWLRFDLPARGRRSRRVVRSIVSTPRDDAGGEGRGPWSQDDGKR